MENHVFRRRKSRRWLCRVPRHRAANYAPIIAPLTTGASPDFSWWLARRASEIAQRAGGFPPPCAVPHASLGHDVSACEHAARLALQQPLSAIRTAALREIQQRCQPLPLASATDSDSSGTIALRQPGLGADAADLSQIPPAWPRRARRGTQWVTTSTEMKVPRPQQRRPRRGTSSWSPSPFGPFRSSTMDTARSPVRR